MERLKKIINTLNNKEVKFIQDYYNKNDEKKRLKLFNGILNKIFKSDDSASKVLYKKKGAAYSQLKSRLKQDLFKLMIFFDDNKNTTSKVVQAEFDVAKLYYQAKVLHKRKLIKESLLLLQKAFIICKEFNLINEKVTITYLYSNIRGNIYGLEDFKLINHDIQHDLEVLKDFYYAFYHRVCLILYNKKTNLNLNEKIKFTYNSYVEIKKLKHLKDSKQIQEHYLYTAIEYFLLINDFKKVYYFAKKMNKLVLNNTEVSSIMRVVISYIQLSTASLKLHKYKVANKYALTAYKLLSNNIKLKGSRNELIILNYVFLSNLREESTKDLKTYLEKGLNHPQINFNKKITEEWQFYKTAYHFKMKEYEEALDTLHTIVELVKGKSGWLFTFKMMEIMCHLELDNFDLVNFRVETFRKLLYKKDNKDLERIKLILKILKTLLKHGFNFKKVKEIEKENLATLQKGEDKYYWDPLGFELVRFDEWFLSR